MNYEKYAAGKPWTCPVQSQRDAGPKDEWRAEPRKNLKLMNKSMFDFQLEDCENTSEPKVTIEFILRNVLLA